ncbi:MAG: hypothetical protein GY863_21690, partial [bacterium]|nr:hypothetical protein [bacterium]
MQYLKRFKVVSFALVTMFLLPGMFSLVNAQEITPELYSDLQYRYIGPG